MDLSNDSASQASAAEQSLGDKPRRPQRIVLADADELAAHDQLLAVIQKESKGKCHWLEGETSH